MCGPQLPRIHYNISKRSQDHADSLPQLLPQPHRIGEQDQCHQRMIKNPLRLKNFLIHPTNKHTPKAETRNETNTKVQTIPSAPYLESHHSRSFSLDCSNSMHTQSAIATSDRAHSTPRTSEQIISSRSLNHQLLARYFSGSTPADTAVGLPTPCAMLVRPGYIELHN